MTRERTESHQNRFPAAKSTPVFTALGMVGAAALVLIIAHALTSGSQGVDPTEASESAVTVQAIPDSIQDQIPDIWTQPRNSSAGRGVWGPDISAPMDTLWRIHTGMEFFSAPALCGQTLFFGGNDGRFRAVDASDGSQEWSYNTACGINGEAAVSESLVFFGGQDGYVYALNRETGSLVWSAGLGYHIFASMGLVADTILVTGTSAGSIAALNAASGEVLWHDTPGGVILGPSLADTLVVFSSEDGIICAYGAGSGEELWRRDFSAQASAPSISGTSVYAGFADGVVRKLNLSSGTVVWETNLIASSTRMVVSRPVSAGGRIIAGTCDGRVVCLSDDDGHLVWETVLENWVQVAPAVGDSAVYVCSDDQRFHVLDLATGEILYSMEMGGYAGTAPLIANGTVFFGTASGNFFAFRATVLEHDGEDR